MPVYEYRCEDCRRRSSLYFQSIAAADAAVRCCPHCKSQRLVKLVSLFSSPKSEDARMEDMADPGNFGDVDENDPRSVARWARKMGQQMGDDLGPEYDEMVDAIERGDDPEGVGDADGMDSMSGAQAYDDAEL